MFLKHGFAFCECSSIVKKKNCLSGSAFSLYDFEELISLNVGDL